MSFEISSKSIFKLQLNEPGVFIINSRKYQIEADDDEAVTKGEIEFATDDFNRVASFQTDPETSNVMQKMV